MSRNRRRALGDPDTSSTSDGENITTGSVPSASLNRSISRSSLLDATSTRADGNNVDIDREMELLGEANLNYSALTQVMTSRIGILRNVINGR